jgi:hypothetical protein
MSRSREGKTRERYSVAMSYFESDDVDSIPKSGKFLGLELFLRHDQLLQHC